MAELCDIGLVGLAVMGENLALNVESRGFKVAVFNRTVDKVDALAGKTQSGARTPRGGQCTKAGPCCKEKRSFFRGLDPPRLLYVAPRCRPEDVSGPKTSSLP